MPIHSSAVVADSAIIDGTAQIGPFAVIGPSVTIKANTIIGAHCVIDGHSVIGENCRIYAGAIIGLEPQDLKYKDEPTGVILGNNCTIREYVTIHRATGEGYTKIGNDCFFMNYSHIAHNCEVGNGVILANGATFAGHCQIGDGAVIGGIFVAHQWVRIGKYCMVSGMTGTRVDLPPFSMCDGRPAHVRGLNVIGMRRQRINSEKRAAIKQAYKLLYRSGLNNSQALTKIEEEIQLFPEIQEICEFFRTSKRGVAVAEPLKTQNEASEEAADVPIEVL